MFMALPRPQEKRNTYLTPTHSRLNRHNPEKLFMFIFLFVGIKMIGFLKRDLNFVVFERFLALTAEVGI